MPDGRKHRRPLDNYALRRKAERTAGRRSEAAAILAKMQGVTLPLLGATDRSWPIEHDRALVAAIAAGATNAALPAHIAGMREVRASACKARWRRIREAWRS